jgi:hypothetical protein
VCDNVPSCPLYCTVYVCYINDSPQTPGVYLGLFADDTCIYATDRKEAYVLRKLQRGLSATETWCKRWNIKINEDKTQAIYFSHRIRPSEAHLALNGRNIPFVDHVKYLGVIFDKRITWRPDIEMIETKAVRTFITIYSLFNSEHLSANIKLSLHKALIRSVLADILLLKLQRLQNKVLRTIGNFSRCTLDRDLHTAFNLSYIYDYITKLCRQETLSHIKSWEWTCSR